MSERAPEYRFDVGGCVIALRCPQAGLAEGLAAWFGLASSPRPADVTLTVEVIAHDDAPCYPRSLLTTKRLLPRGNSEAAADTPAAAQPFDISGGLIRGWYDPARGAGVIKLKAALLEGRHPRIFEQLLYQAHRSALQRREQTAWLVHSSAVIAGGVGYLFVGPSGAGKSTVAALSAAHHVLGDEMNLLLPRPGGGWDVAGTPFNGPFRAKRPGSAPLAAVLLLEHGPAPELRDPEPAVAVAALAAEIVPPVGLDQAPGPGTLPAMVEAAHAVAAHTALKTLRFAPDAGFWPLLTTTFGSL